MRYPETYEQIIKEENINDGGYVQMEWNDTVCEALETGTVCPIDGDYLLLSKYWPSQSSVYSWRYAPRFVHRLAQLDYLPFYLKTEAVRAAGEGGGVAGAPSGESSAELQGGVEYEDVLLSTYPYTGDLATIANALAECLSDHGELGTWTAETDGVAAGMIQSISFDGATIKSAAAAIADAFGVDYHFEWGSHRLKFVISGADMSGVQNDPGVEAGGGSGGVLLVGATDGGVQYNTFRILGGTKNMSRKTLKGQNVQVTERLKLDGESVLGGGSPKIMKDLVFDEIYPKMELWLYDVHERRCWLTDENGKKIVDGEVEDAENGGVRTTYKRYSKWYFKLACWNGEELVPYRFDRSLILEGLPLSMVFQANYEDGALPQPLTGREFELTYFDAPNPAREKDADDIGEGYQPVQGEYRIIFKVDGGMILPSTMEDGLRPYGDGMSLRNNKVTLTNVAMDDAYLKAAKAELRKAGEAAVAAYGRSRGSFTYVTYGEAPQLGGGVTSVRKNLITGEVQYTVGDMRSSKGLIGRLSDKIDTLNTGGSSGTQHVDGGTSSSGGVSESSLPLLSRLMGSGSVVKDSLTILKELILGVNGHGVYIDGRGDASMTIGSLTVLGTTHLSEIDVNHIKHTGGLMVVTKAQMIVDHVEHLEGGLDRLYFRRMNAEGQVVYNQFEVGDLALMMVFNERMDGSVGRYYWREVTAVDDGDEEWGHITLLPSSASHSDPRAGDVVVQLGNTMKEERQGVTVLGGSGRNGGFLAVYDGFKTWRESAPMLDDYDRALTYISPKRNKLTGDFVSLGGEDLRLEMDELRASMLGVREQSDKQLVIWYGEQEPAPSSANPDEWNEPAKEWHEADVAAGNEEQELLHVEDVFYLRRDNVSRKGGRAWQWIYDELLERFLWVEITDADTIAALEAADNAVETANDAKRMVENLADDGIISAGSEKSQLLIVWQETVCEYVKYLEQARDYGLDLVGNELEGSGEAVVSYSPYNEYVRRFRSLALMLNGGKTDGLESVMAGSVMPEWLVSVNTDTVLAEYGASTGFDYRMVWKEYHDSRSCLLKSIEEAAKVKTEAAQQDATKALGLIGDMGSDSRLDASEKLTVKREFVAAWRERDAEGGILDRCTNDAGGYINSTIGTKYVLPYVTSFLNLASYMNGKNTPWLSKEYSKATDADMPLWLRSERMGMTEDIDGGRWLTAWTNFHTARTALLTALTDDARERADGAKATADVKKRIFQTEDNVLPPAPYDVGDLWVNAVWYTEKDGSRIYKWTGEVLYCKVARTTDSTRSINDWTDAQSGTTARIANLGSRIEQEVKDRKAGMSSLLKLDSTSGSLTVEEYDERTDEWTEKGRLELLLAEGDDGLYSKLNLTADNVVIDSELLEVISEGVKINAEQVDFNTGEFRIKAEHIDFTGHDFGLKADDIDFTGYNFKVKANDIDFAGGTLKIGAEHIDFTGHDLGLKADDIDFTGYNFKVKANDIDFAGGTLKIDAEHIDFTGHDFGLKADDIDFTGYNFKVKANDIDFAGGTLKIDAEHIDFTGHDFGLKADDIDFTGYNFKVKANDIDFAGGTLKIDAEHIDFTGHDFGLKADDIDFTGYNFKVKASDIDFAGGTLKIDADHINFKGKTVINGKFEVDGEGNVSMDGFKATSADITGSITVPADGGRITYNTGTAAAPFGLFIDSSQAFTSGRSDYLKGSTERGAIVRVEQKSSATSYRGIYCNGEVEIQGVTQLLRTASKQNSPEVDALIVEGIDNKGNLTLSGAVKTASTVTLPKCKAGGLLICTNPTSIGLAEGVAAVTTSGEMKTSGGWTADGRARIFVGTGANLWREICLGV